MFDVLPPSSLPPPPLPRQPPTIFSIFSFFGLFLSFVFFHAKLRSQISKFQLRTSKVEPLKSGFKVQTSNFKLRSWNFEPRRSPPSICYRPSSMHCIAGDQSRPFRFWIQICQGLQDVSDALTSCFGLQGVLEGSGRN